MLATCTLLNLEANTFIQFDIKTVLITVKMQNFLTSVIATGVISSIYVLYRHLFKRKKERVSLTTYFFKKRPNFKLNVECFMMHYFIFHQLYMLIKISAVTITDAYFREKLSITPKCFPF